MTAEELIRSLRARLAPIAAEAARFEARQLAACALGIEAGRLQACPETPVTAAQQASARALLDRRLSGEPLQYILGEWAFMGLPMRVRPGALIPRADTEVLCERALALARERGYRSALDLCCGTGCIGIALAKLAGLDVTCTDIDPGCLALTGENAALNAVTVRTVESDLFSALGTERFDLICCNPPYLSDADMAQLQRELTFEPALALHGGADGLSFYTRISRDCRAHLNGRGALLLEIGSTQADRVRSLFQNSRLFCDYAGNPRVILMEEA